MPGRRTPLNADPLAGDYQDTMRDEIASETAIAAAVLRAAHQILDREPRVLDDPVSLGLVPGAAPDEISGSSERLELPFMRVLRSSFIARSRIAEDVVGRAVSGGVRQYVVLGAGFDTFAYRQPPWAAGVEIYELDHPASQRAKAAALRGRGLSPPANLHMCPINFEQESLLSVLQRAGFDHHASAVFSWLGVVPYLSMAAIDATLRQIVDSAPELSAVISYVVPDRLLSGADAEAVAVSSAAAARRGEPWLSRFTPQEFDAQLRMSGFGSIQHFGPEEYETLHFSERPDGLAAPSFERLVVGGARVAG